MTYMIRISALFSLLLSPVLIAAPAAAQTQCAQFELLGNGARAEYQPFESSPTVESFDVRVRRLADGIGGVRFLLVDRTPQSSGPQIGLTGPQIYDISWLEDSTRRVLVVGNEQPQPMTGADLNFPGRSGVQITRFRLTVPAGQQAPAQIHREDLVVRYQCLGANGNPIGATQEQPAALEISLTVPRYVAAYIGSVGQTRGTISFGDVAAPSASLTRAIGITALSTLPYAIEFSSENDTMLKRRRDDSAGIAYAMRYAGVPVLDGETLVCPITPAPMGRGEQFEVALDRGSISRLSAGDYADTVTLTFTPRDAVGVSACAVGSGTRRQVSGVSKPRL
jgi:spore coat protein U-like protein